MVGLSVLNVEGVMEASAGRPWEHVLVVARWITQFGTVQGWNKAADRARVGVTPEGATIAERQDISNENVPSSGRTRRKAVMRQASQARAGARPPRQGFTSCPRTRTIMILGLFFSNSVELHGTEPRMD